MSIAKRETISRLVASTYTSAPTLSVPKREFKNEFNNGEYSPIFGEITCQGGTDLLDHALSRLNNATLVDLGSGIGRFCLHSALTHCDFLDAIHGVELSPSRHDAACDALDELRLKIDKTHLPCLDKIKFHNMNLLEFKLPSTPLIIYCASLTFSSTVISAIQDRITRSAPKKSLLYSCREFESDENLVHVAEINLETSWAPQAEFHVYETRS